MPVFLIQSLDWKFHTANAGVDAGGTAGYVQLPAKFKEIKLIGKSSASGYWSEITIPYESLTNNEIGYISGYYYPPNAANNASCICYGITKTTCRVLFASSGMADSSTAYYYSLYYR